MSIGGEGCNLNICDIKQSVFQYQPSLAANGLFIALFGASAVIHTVQGAIYKQYTFASLIIIGCVCEMIGYGGRILMHNNPWSFAGFMMQIVCITIAPVFITAAIYVQLYKTVEKLSLKSAKFRPSLYYQIFIPCDIISLALQAAGGALSSQSEGSSKTGVAIGLAGLSFQVATLLVFIILAVQYALQYRKDVKTGKVPSDGLNGRFKWFLAFLSFSTLVVFIRCVFRIYELSNGYSGEAIHNEPMFIGLESVMIVLSVFALNIGHPGLVFNNRRKPTFEIVESQRGYSSSDEPQKEKGDESA